MRRTTIAVVDFVTGAVTERDSSTSTLDVPGDLDRATTTALFDAGALLHYATGPGCQVARPAFSRPLSWRARGEVCLIETRRTRKAAGPIAFRLAAVERAPQRTMAQALTRRD